MRIVCISDTHSQNLLTKWKSWPEGDILIHAGDMTARGSHEDLKKIGRELLQLPYKYRIVVSGNHDRAFWQRDSQKFLPNAWSLLPGIIVLENEAITIGGVKFYGTAWLSFSRDDSEVARTEAINFNELWRKIPSDTDVVITHLPPYGILDRNRLAQNIGSETLRQEITGRVKPTAHIFGHVHGNRGTLDFGGIKFINASLVDEEYQPTNDPIVIEVDGPREYKINHTKKAQ